MSIVAQNSAIITLEELSALRLLIVIKGNLRLCRFDSSGNGPRPGMVTAPFPLTLTLSLG
jgi:hypothetical protein